MFLRNTLAVLCVALSLSSLNVFGSHSNSGTDDKIVGRWDMTIQESDGGQYPSWFEVTGEPGKLAGRFVGRVGSQRPIKTIEFANGHLTFSLPVQ